MPDTPRTKEAILQAFSNNNAGLITAQMLRDFVASVSVTTPYVHEFNPTMLSCDLLKSNTHFVVLTDDTTFEVANDQVGQELRIIIQQDGVGGHTADFWEEIRWQFGQPRIDPTPDSVTTFSLVKLDTGEWIQFGSTPSWLNETPAGTVDGDNDEFSLSYTPFLGSLQLYKNGLLQREGPSNDFTLSQTTLTMTAGAVPQIGDELAVTYAY